MTPPPPPPARQSTAPPESSKPGPQSSPLSVPPIRPNSAVDVTSRSLGAPPPRTRSNLVPNGTAGSSSAPPSPPSRSTTGSAPPGRPKSSTAKRSVRSRYVDVFASDGGGQSS